MTPEKVQSLRQSIINALWANTELGEQAIYRIVEDILRRNNLIS